jgi:hypothetical protein
MFRIPTWYKVCTLTLVLSAAYSPLFLIAQYYR